LWASIVIASLLRFALQNYAFKHTSANNAGMIMILEPMWTALLGAAYLEETLEPNQWVGCTLIFAAILVYQMIRFFLWRKLVNPPATENLESVG
jgi:drug/metabolite transporter (DMT)-like permease